MTKKDLDCLKKYLDIKVGSCNISDIQAQDIYDMMRLNCLKEPINEENIKRLCVGARALCGVLDENGIDCPEKEFVSNMADNLMSEL